MTDATDDKVVDRIRKLLAQAEGTNFGPEAETAIAMAHELMARYSIDEVKLHEAKGIKDSAKDVIVKQMRVSQQKKFRDQRHALLHQISMLNRSRAIITNDFMTILGFPRDVENVEVMYTSLVVQMFGALFMEPQHTSQTWADNFCFGFVERIVRRLKDVKRDVEAEVAPQGSSTALVLVSRGEMVEQKTKEKFPSLSQARVKKVVVDPFAGERGRQAADRSDIGQGGVGTGTKGGLGQAKKELS